MCEQEETFGVRKLRNNNPRGGIQTSDDANANEIQTEDGGTTGDAGSLSGLNAEFAVQDRVIIWGTDSQCDDPELAEFEMLECQELEAYLVEDGEDFVGLADQELQDQLSAKQAAAGRSRGQRSAVREQESAASQLSESRELTRTELSSDTDVFVTCLSNISSIATATPVTDSGNLASGSHSAVLEDQTLDSHTCGPVSERGQRDDNTSLFAKKSTTHQRDLDVNLNSWLLSENVESQAQERNDEHKQNNNQRNDAGNTISEGDCDYTEHEALSSVTKALKESSVTMDKSTQADGAHDVMRPGTGTEGTQSSTECKAIKKQGSFDNTPTKQNSFDRSVKKQPSFEKTLKKQLSFENTSKKPGSFENAPASSSSSLERRKPWGSPARPASPKTPSCSPKRRPSSSPARVQSPRAQAGGRSDSPCRAPSQPVKPPAKTGLSSGIPKPVVPQQKEVDPRRSSPIQRPKNVRPKIITYVRKNTQAKQDEDAGHEDSTHPARSSHCGPPAHRDSRAVPQSRSTPVLSSSNALFDKYRQEMQRAGYCPPGPAVGGVRPPGGHASQRQSGRSESFHEEMSRKYLQEHVSQEAGGVYRSPRALRPQLGLGAVTRQPAAKTRAPQTNQKPCPASHQPARAPTAAHQEPSGLGEQRRSGPETAPKGILLRSGQSGLRPPGFSSLPVARLASLGFVRSSSVSSVSSNQSSESTHSDPCRVNQRESPSLHRVTSTLSEIKFRYHTVPPSELSLRREVTDATPSPKSSPKRFAVVSPKPHSPAHGQNAGVQGSGRTVRAQEVDRALIQQLQERCELQALQLQSLQAQLKKAFLCLDVFSITTQHFCLKSESAVVKERELSLELTKIRDEVACSVAHWEQLQREKADVERRFEAELGGLRVQQQEELGALEERLRAQHMDATENLQAIQQAELQELQFKQQEQLEEVTENHEASLLEMETTHNDTLATLQEEHARTVKNLKMAHEQQKKSLEEEFLKIRLSLQDQVDTLTFQNRSLRDRAKRFEEALRKSTDEQIVDALAPYKHIEEDLKSLKEVLEMKNQQIHQQEQKISELEKIAEKNVYLEERLQVLQQQNEDLKERIDKNLAVSRQLSEENANLQVHVEKESNEKKRLSRTNEELMWRLQTGELSPHMTPTSSPIHRPPSGPCSPARPHSYHQ
ncbi:microtubule-associated tumor suppressor candidate 2 homolog [Menidia menidia]